MIKIKIIKIVFILFIFYVLIRIYKFYSFENNIKVCLCTPAKKENLYLKEFVEHYKSFQIDKIYLYDNNNINGEHFEDVINNYIQSGYVEIINFRGKERALYNMMNDCYRKNYKNYDWLLFYEIDEYIHLKNYNNIKKFLLEDKFDKCQSIQLNWVMHTDNEHIYYYNKSLKKRFPLINDQVKSAAVKTILRGKIPNVNISCVHRLNSHLKSCDGFGNLTHLKGPGTDKLDYKYYYIDHYFCKSTEEFINKINKGDVLYNQDNFIKRLKVYFLINKVNKEKINYIQKNLRVNISWKKIVNNYSNFIK